ncbi:MAG: hypothetical protein ACI37Z_05080 [Candidatus Gastranaerophilaceae bacterium]
MKDYEIISVQYCDPRQPSLFVKSTRSDREFVKYYLCNNKENCELYKNKSCVMKCGLYGGRCPYGKVSQTEGYTKAARKCGYLIKKAKDTYPDKLYAVKEPKRIGFVGDYVYTGLPFIYDCRTPFRPKDSDFWCGKELINSKYFTPEIIVELIKYKPYPWFGYNPIESYKDKYLPEFCFQLKKYMPDMYNQVKDICPEIEKIADISFIGKKAKLNTFLPGEIILGSDVFNWDGKILVLTKPKYSRPYKVNGKICIEPDNEVVEIYDNNTVDENTVFVD